MRHYWLTCDAPDLPADAFRRAPGRNRPATLEGGGKGGGGGPSYPDPNVVASATTQTNKDTAAYNKALNLNNYSNPFGSQQSQVVGTDPTSGAPIYNTTITANPQLQSALTSLLGQTSQSSAINAGALNGLMGLSSSLTNRDANGMTQAQNAYYNQAKSYLDPQFAQQGESLDAKLANQGLAPGSQAYDNAMTNFNNAKTFAYNQAQDSAITQGTQLGLQTAGTQAGLYGQQVGIGQAPYSNLQTIAGMIPGYSGTSQSAASPADISGLYNNQYQSQLANYNARQSSSNGMMSGLFGLGSAAMLAFA
ncbi:conserved protein of unknown function [Burkholderia multivorans]